MVRSCLFVLIAVITFNFFINHALAESDTFKDAKVQSKSRSLYWNQGDITDQLISGRAWAVKESFSDQDSIYLWIAITIAEFNQIKRHLPEGMQTLEKAILGEQILSVLDLPYPFIALRGDFFRDHVDEIRAVHGDQLPLEIDRKKRSHYLSDLEKDNAKLNHQRLSYRAKIEFEPNRSANYIAISIREFLSIEQLVNKDERGRITLDVWGDGRIPESLLSKKGVTLLASWIPPGATYVVHGLREDVFLRFQDTILGVHKGKLPSYITENYPSKLNEKSDSRRLRVNDSSGVEEAPPEPRN